MLLYMYIYIHISYVHIYNIYICIYYILYIYMYILYTVYIYILCIINLYLPLWYFHRIHPLRSLVLRLRLNEAPLTGRPHLATQPPRGTAGMVIDQELLGELPRAMNHGRFPQSYSGESIYNVQYITNILLI